MLMQAEVTLDDVMEEMNALISSYHFPLAVLTDVNYRLNGNADPYYANQQLTYMKNIINAGLAIPRE